MLFPTDIQKLHEHIKEYFAFAKFENSYECFEAEINTKIVSKKLVDLDFDITSEKSPELVRMLKGISSNTILNRKREQQLEEANERYIDLLAAARQIYSLVIKLMNLCENEKSVNSGSYAAGEREGQQRASGKC